MGTLGTSVLAAAGLLALVGLAEGLRRLGVGATGTRRLVHVGVGLFVVATPVLFERPAPVAALAVLFVLGNAWALRGGRWPSIHEARQRSWGTVLFPASLLPVLALTWGVDASRVWMLQAAYLVLALADPLAGWVGQRLGRHPYRVGKHAKTMEGSAAFFACSALLVGSAAWMELPGAPGTWTLPAAVLAALTAALVATAAEAAGGRGWDNLFVVLAVVGVLIPFAEDVGVRGRLVVGMLCGALFIPAVLSMRWLTGSGALAGGLFAASLVGWGGLAWAAPALAFFVSSSAWSVVGRWRKQSAASQAEKGSVRDAGQVMANGGVAWAVLGAYALLEHDPLWYAAFVGALAAAAADTWATEVGTLGRSRPVDLRTGRRVPPGTSGAVSLVGTLGAMGGASCVAAVAWWAHPAVGPALVVGAAAAGVLGALVDSLVGATLQAQYRDAQGLVTERAATPDGVAHLRVRGVRWLTNDVVNVVCTAAGALLAAGFAALSA